MLRRYANKLRPKRNTIQAIKKGLTFGDKNSSEIENDTSTQIEFVRTNSQITKKPKRLVSFMDNTIFVKSPSSKKISTNFTDNQDFSSTLANQESDECSFNLDLSKVKPSKDESLKVKTPKFYNNIDYCDNLDRMLNKTLTF